MPNYRKAQPHGEIKQVFNNIFIVTGTNQIHHDGINLQFSRNMIIVRENNTLTLINTVRLNDEGLAALNNLGKVINVVRIGAFHGYDDAFYLDHYKATFWAIKGMTHQSGRQTDVELEPNGLMPFSHCTLFNFTTTAHHEGILLIQHTEGNILVTCDSVQNWSTVDAFFNEATAQSFQAQSMIKPANIPDTWLQACKPEISELKKLKELRFKHLLSAHGEPLKESAYEKLCETLQHKFNI